ncbi:ATP-grasp domain-containing protein [Lachnospiraceae bacterium 56-18]
MEKPIFLLLGGNKLNYGVMHKFQNVGYRVFIIDWNANPRLIGNKHYQIDVKDAHTIIATLKQDGYWNDVKFAYSSIDLAVSSVASINRAIGLKTISGIGLRYSSSKSMMTQRWGELGLLNRISKHYKQFSDEIVDMGNMMKLIIKPDNSASSRGITIIDQNSNKELIEKAFDKAKKEATNHIVVVEEFVEGTEYTVEMLGDAYGNVCVYAISRKTHTIYADNNKIAVKLHYNCMDDALQHRIAEFGIKCYKALHFSSSLGHLEILIKKDGCISPVEIGARSSGFIASDLVDIVSGANFLGDLIRVQNGEKVKEGLHPQTDLSSMYFFYDFPNGKQVVKENNLLDYCDKEITSRYFDRSNIILNHRFYKIDNDNARQGFEILEGKKEMMTREYINDSEQRMLKEILAEVNDDDDT